MEFKHSCRNLRGIKKYWLHLQSIPATHLLLLSSPASSVSSSCSHINHEPAVTAAHEETGDEQSEEEDGDEGSDGDDRGEGKKEIRFGPPRGHPQAKAGSNHHEPLAEGDILFYYSCFMCLISFIDIVKSTTHDDLVEGYIFINLVSFHPFIILSRY